MYFETETHHYAVAFANPYAGWAKLKVAASERPIQKGRTFKTMTDFQTISTATHNVYGGIEPSKRMLMFVIDFKK